MKPQNTLDGPVGLSASDIRPIRDEIERRVLALLDELGVAPRSTQRTALPTQQHERK